MFVLSNPSMILPTLAIKIQKMKTHIHYFFTTRPQSRYKNSETACTCTLSPRKHEGDQQQSKGSVYPDKDAGLLSASNSSGGRISKDQTDNWPTDAMAHLTARFHA